MMGSSPARQTTETGRKTKLARVILEINDPAWYVWLW
jgi:hypothetical protein